MQRVVMHSEGRRALLDLARSQPHALHDDFHSRVENRDGYTHRQLLQAYDHAALCRTEFDAIAAGYDAVLTPSALGEAPTGRDPGAVIAGRPEEARHDPWSISRPSAPPRRSPALERADREGKTQEMGVQRPQAFGGSGQSPVFLT